MFLGKNFRFLAEVAFDSSIFSVSSSPSLAADVSWVTCASSKVLASPSITNEEHALSSGLPKKNSRFNAPIIIIIIIIVLADAKSVWSWRKIVESSAEFLSR